MPARSQPTVLPTTAPVLDREQPLTTPAHLAAALCVAIPPLVVLFLLPPLAQPAAYHAFADTRPWLSLPNVLDVLTNLPFLLVGLLGLRAALRLPPVPHRACWLAFAGGVALVAFGSGFYHFSPANASLVWDRLPMTFAFTSLFAAVLGETVSPRLGRRLLLPLLLAGIVAVLWWQRRGDLRPYFAVQALALAGVPVLLVLLPRHGDGRGWLVAGLGCYALAFAAEQSDHAVFALTGSTFSGHSLKHILAALACTAVVAMLSRRRTAGSIPPKQHEPGTTDEH